MSYRVLAPLILVKVADQGDDYRVDYHYQGSVIPRLSPDQRERFLADGFIEELDGSNVSSDSDRPRKTASQADWAAYAVTQGADADEAAAASRQELIELYGG